ncbi:hypothetical protein Daura_23320 [Dactylosporangium aurantiacum]|uniref:Uncharacterized protein n=1 Tax=Dactylosporangium aurantiacum TaxID=35754 RepID=A0A9Q9MLD2_9ACTN|nr:hypothetical protein [Dactylosporangium aurantiacum]MDG6103982.1 hypothetical protein [Dactylosporangium aurantiacum]UWZ58840.1 hypothetical protein Daura_23320 [Dactylosporangium aurantiacum]
MQPHGGRSRHDDTRRRRPRAAWLVLWSAVWVVLFDLAVGGSWDGEYHRTQPFDGFFSPPHLFIYTFAAIAMTLVAVLNLRPALRDCFGATLPLPGPVPFLGTAHPGALVLLSGGFAGIAFAGPADASWHTGFGLDETNWSFPHAMLGCSLALIALGVLASRIALQGVRPMWAPTRYLIGYLAVFACAVFMGPLQNYPTRQFAITAGSSGALGVNPDYQHLVRIVDQANLTHTNPAYVIVAAAWTGLALGLLRAIDRRARYWLVVAVLVAFSLAGTAADEAARYGLADDARAVTGLPLLTAAVTFAVTFRVPELVRYLLAGATFSIHVYAVWGTAVTPYWYALAAAVAPAAVVGGAVVARWIHRVVVAPARPATLALVIAAVAGVPALTGTVDLALRSAIP